MDKPRVDSMAIARRLTGLVFLPFTREDHYAWAGVTGACPMIAKTSEYVVIVDDQGISIEYFSDDGEAACFTIRS